MACEFSRRGGVVKMQSKSVSASTTGAVVVKPDAGYTGLDQVSVAQVKVQEKTAAPSTSQQIFTPDNGFTGLSKVTVGAIKLQGKVVIPSASQQTVKPDAGYNGLSQVVVGGVKLQSKTVTAGTVQQTVTPDSGYTGLSQVIINPPSGQTVKKITATVAGDAKNYLDISNTAGISDILAVYVCASISYARLSDGQIYSAAYFKDANATNGAMVKTTGNGISALLPTAVGVSLVSGNIRVQVAVPNIFLYADYNVCIYGT